MRRNMTYGVGLSILSVLLGVSLASAATPRPAMNAATQHSASGQQIVIALRSVEKVLAGASYNGYCVKAAQEVQQALAELGSQQRQGTRTASSRKAKAGTVANNQTVNEQGANNQAASTVAQSAGQQVPIASEPQLRQAQRLLQTTLAQLNGQFPKAATHITAAMAEINAALGKK
jgi:hypothetical protein